MNRYLIAALTVVILFVLPGISWFYLKSGLDYHKQAKAELSDLGKVPSFSLPDQNNQTIDPASLSGKITVFQFLPSDIELAKQLINRLSKVHQSFNESDDVLFITVWRTDQTDQLLNYAVQLGIEDHKQWYLLGASGQHLSDLISGFNLENAESSIILVDGETTVRKVYNINQDTEMGRLVEHVAILVPKKRSR